MKKNQTMVLIALAAMAIAAVSCATTTPEAAQAKSDRQRAAEASLPIRTEPAVRPDWIDNVPDSAALQSFVGTSLRMTRANLARNAAMEDGREQLIDYYGTLIENKARTHTATFGIANEVLSPQIAGQQLRNRVATNLSQALAARNYYTEVYLMNNTNEEGFEVYVLMQIDKAIVKRFLDNYGQEQAADLARKAAAEQDARRRQQLEKAAEFFGGNLSSTMGL